MFVFIVNPTAGNGRSKQIFTKIRKSPIYNQIASNYFFTEYSGHAEEIIKQIVENTEKINCIIVIGGDGTLHEVVNGLSNKSIPLTFIPAGSGNDFARGAKIKGKPLTIFEQIVNGKNRIPYWLGNYHLDGNSKRVLVNSMGFGFDAEVARAANRSSYKKIFNRLRLGTLSYCIALISVLIHFKPMTIELELNGKKRFLSNCWMITIANHPYYGGGMKIIPHAKIQPTTFPVLLIHSISKWKVLALFLTVFTGKHVNYKEVELVEASQLKISSKKIIPYQVDGQTSMCTSCSISKQHHPIHVNGTENIHSESEEIRL